MPLNLRRWSGKLLKTEIQAIILFVFFLLLANAVEQIERGLALCGFSHAFGQASRNT